jgi:hypothetical protein
MSSVKLWLGLHAGASRLLIPSYYTAPSLTTSLPSLSFVRSCFNLSSLLLSRSTRYSHTIPYIPHSCNNVLSTLTTSSSTYHTSFTYSLAGPKLKIWRHLVFYFGPTTDQTQIPWALAPGAHFWCAPSCTPSFFCLRPGVLAPSSRRHLRVHTS